MSSGASCRCLASMEDPQVYSGGLGVKMDAYVAGSPKIILLLGTATTGLGLQANWSLSPQGTAQKTDTLLTKEMHTLFCPLGCLYCCNSNQDSCLSLRCVLSSLYLFFK